MPIHPSAIAVGRALEVLLPAVQQVGPVGALLIAMEFLRDPATLHWADGMDQHGYTTNLRGAINGFLENFGPYPRKPEGLDLAEVKH